ncbi:hypothetical protein [Spiroplasma endosymbiont of Ammophila pubescens]|uniref:hypothetical protein n=1 Tax=Spiroplasma endosymbiont of Ammophila pubescens TaxID=3066315 RepID=UPI0032B2018D
MGEIDNHDIYHFYRSFPEYMVEWIKDLKEGESAFNGKIKPYKIVDGQKIELKSAHLGNKFRRLFWDKIGSCITTRNDQLASQDTIHPSDNRVLSIRKLMKLMTIPNSFNWTNLSNTELNSIELKTKQLFLRKNELNIRRIIGESVPTKIFYDMAKNIKEILDYDNNLILKNKENFYINLYLVEKQIINVKETGFLYTTKYNI